MAHVTPADRAAEVQRFREGKSTGKELIGKPVVALSSGERLGEIHDVVYSPREGRLIGFTIPHGGGLFRRGDTLWLAAESIHSLGQDAVTVQSPDLLETYDKSVGDVAEQAGEPVLGKRLMTDDGEYLGAIDDVLIDRQTRRVVAYEVSGGIWQDMMRGQTDVPVEQIVSIGADVVVVPALVREHVEQASGGLAAVASAAQERAIEWKESAAGAVAHARSGTAQSVENWETRYTLGRKAGRNVYLDDAETVVLVQEGETITQAQIDRAVAAGKMHALALAAGAGHAGDAAQATSEKLAAATATVKEKAADLTDAAKDRYGQALVGKTTGRAVLSDTGDVLIPASRVLTSADVEVAKSAGKLDDLTGAVGAATWDSSREQISTTVDAAKERVGDAYAAARERLEAERASAEAERAAAEAKEAAASSRAAAAPGAGAPAAPVVVVENPETVVIEAPAVAVTDPARSRTTATAPASVPSAPSPKKP